MLFPTVAFATFFLVAFTLNWLLRPTYRIWRVVMIGLSLYFYGYADTRFVTLLIVSIVVNWAFGAAIGRATATGEPTAASRNLVRAAVVVNIGFLGYYKYYGFFVESFADALDSIGLGASPPILQILLPVGISFFTFHAISYVVDIGRGELRPDERCSTSALPVVLPPPGGRADRAGERAAAADGAHARPAADPVRARRSGSSPSASSRRS